MCFIVTVCEPCRRRASCLSLISPSCLILKHSSEEMLNHVECPESFNSSCILTSFELTGEQTVTPGCFYKAQGDAFNTYACMLF